MNFQKKLFLIFQAKIHKHSKNSINPWYLKLLVLASVGVLSCQDDPTRLGEALLKPNDKISAFVTDTLTLNTSTVLLDSVVTSNTDHLLVGSYYDPIFGGVEASSYFEVTTADSLKSNAQSVLDSVVLSLGYKYYFGDTTKPQEITVHRVKEKIGRNTGTITKRLLESLNTRITYYNTDKLNYDPTPLGSTGFTVQRPVRLKSKRNAEFDSLYSELKIKLDPAFGKELLSLGGKKAGKGLTDFKDYMKGFLIKPKPGSNAAIYGFEPSNTPAITAFKPSYLGLYYHTEGKKDTLTNFFVVSFGASPTYNNRFYNLNFDRTGTVLENLKKPNDRIQSNPATGEAYVQASAGVACKLDIPYLKNLAKDGKVAINRVDLIIKPIKDFGNFVPTVSLNLVRANPNNTYRPLRTATGDLLLIPSEPSIGAKYGVYDRTLKQYEFNLTTYIQNVLNGAIPNDGFFINSAGVRTVNRLVFDKTSIKLKVYYTKAG